MIQNHTVSIRHPAPILVRTEVLVIGETFAACAAAQALAAAGHRTALAATACSLPFETVVCRRPWATEADLARLPPPFSDAFRDSVAERAASGACILNLAKLALGVEDILLDAGVRLFYGLTPCGIRLGRGESASERTVAAVIFGGKFGLAAIEADRLIDATPCATLAALAGHAPRRRQQEGARVRVAFAAKVGFADDDSPITQDRGQRNTCPSDGPAETVLSVPGAAALEDERITLHGPYADIRLRLPVEAGNFRRAHLSNAARTELIGIGTLLGAGRRAGGKRPLCFHRFPGGLLTEPMFRIRAAGTDAPHRPDGLANVWVCGPASDVDEHHAATLADPFAAAAVRGLVDAVSARLSGRVEPAAFVFSAVAPPHAPAMRGELRFRDAPPLHAAGDALPLGAATLPMLETCDVLVVGGGTAGVPAALAAARAGARTVLLEQHADLGGVRTTGGVGAYWFGRETPWQRALDEAYDRYSEASGVAEEAAMLRLLLDAGVHVLTGTPTVGVVREGARLGAAVVATEYGLGLVRAKVVVDASGDGDAAAWAGAPFAYGNGRDAWTLWASFANFNAEKRTASRQYESSMETRDPWDFVRTVVTGRRRQGMWQHFAHEMPQHYAAPRESRRLLAEAAVTYGGILAGETFADLAIVCEANFDIKGIASSDMACSGVVASWRLRTNFRAAVPYRALLPRGLDNVLVACRAYAASHDALSLARMQRDMISLGASAGIAAALAAATDTSPARLDIMTLQAEWIRLGVLRAADRRRYGRAPTAYTTADAERDVRALLRRQARSQRLLARLVRSPASLQPLRHAFTEARGRALKTKIARALCLLGDDTGVAFLLDTVAAQIRNGLPRPRRRTQTMPPEHGWAADPAYSLYALGLAGRGAEAAALLEKVALAVEDNAERFTSRQDSQFEYARTLCAVAERNPGPAMLPALEALLGKQCLRGLSLRFDADVRESVDSVLERRAYLELCLGRALARCGDRRGYAILLDYAHDIRGTLARSAEEELGDLLDIPAANKPTDWCRILAARSTPLPRKAFTRRIE